MNYRSGARDSLATTGIYHEEVYPLLVFRALHSTLIAFYTFTRARAYAANAADTRRRSRYVVIVPS